MNKPIEDYIEIKEHNDGYSVNLIVDHQGFKIDTGGLRPQEEAEWYKKMLVKALTRLVEQQK